MPEIAPAYALPIVALLVLLEAGLLWAAAALGDAPVLSWAKLLFVSFGVTLLWVAILAATAWFSGVLSHPLDPENQTSTLLFGIIALVVTWAIPTVLYAPLVPLPLARSMRVAVFQALLRAFAYVLLAAVVFVGLAIVQIWAGADVRAILFT